MPITFVKSVNTPQQIVGNELIYTLTVTNSLGIILTSVIVSDLLNESLGFVAGSVTVGGIPVPEADILAGVELGSMGLNATRIVTFRALVENNNNHVINNTSTAVYSYIDPNFNTEVTEVQESQPVTVTVEVAEITCEKTADVEVASLNDIIEYTVVLENTGTLTAVGVVYFDELPGMLELVEDSVEVDGVTVNNADLEAGIVIGTMLKGDSVTITYRAKVIGGSCTGVAVNKGHTEFIYILSETSSGTKVSDSCSVSVEITISAFKQLMMSKKMCLPSASPDIEDIDNAVAQIQIDDYYIISTNAGISYESQHLTNHKLIIHGMLDISLLYTALKIEQQLHSVSQKYPFSSFIILPANYTNETVEVSALIEDTAINQLDGRCVDVGVTMLLVAKFR